MSQKKSTEKTLASIVLAFEIVVVFLTGLTLFGLKVTEPNYIPLIFAGAGILLLIVALGLMRRSKAGVIIGWVLHVLFFLPMIVMPAVGILAFIFGAFWVYSVLKGKQIDRMRESHIHSLNG